MGRIKGRNIKVLASMILDALRQEFVSDFSKNKEILKQKTKELGLSKLEFNKLTGEITRKIKAEERKSEDETSMPVTTKT